MDTSNRQLAENQGVVEKRDGQWVIAQMHLSFAKD